MSRIPWGKYVLAGALLQQIPFDRQRRTGAAGAGAGHVLHQRFYLSEIPFIDFWTAREMPEWRPDSAIPQLRKPSTTCRCGTAWPVGRCQRQVGGGAD